MVFEQPITIEVLLVEDNSTDVLLTQEAFAAMSVSTRLHTVNDGSHALDFLRKAGNYRHVPRPSLILLDLNLPVKDGFELLSEIKTDKTLADIPVIVLSTSNQKSDVAKAYLLHANCYIVKPVGFSRFREVIKAIESFWFHVAEIPAGE